MVGPAKLKRAGPLKVFALQEHPSVGDFVQASTAKDRCDARNAIQGMHSILNERERHVAHRPSHAWKQTNKKGKPETLEREKGFEPLSIVSSAPKSASLTLAEGAKPPRTLPSKGAHPLRNPRSRVQII
jgi:hypothetical protein